jgi:hypothetical protein
MRNTLKSLLFILASANLSAFAQQFNGYTLTSIINGSTATLIDTNQSTFKTWSGLSASTGYSAFLEPGGTLVRSCKGGTNPVGVPGGPICGKIQKHSYAGTLLWDFPYYGADYITHHDIQPMPNGNVLAICYHKVAAADVTAAGGSQNIDMWPDKIVEIQPNGLNGGTVVWEWRIWDHIMQNTDPNKPNYFANVVDHPERLNLNYKQAKDWIHMNGVDYNPMLDQVTFSSHNMNEWYIIDHSTTTAEAAGHTGGNSGKGGDFLYRWGNPAAYGAAGTAILNVTHDAHWIPEGCPNAGRLAGFNNKGVSPSQSAADQITTPVNGYNYDHVAGQAYAPATYSDRHECNGFSSNMGGTQQFPNGNQLICIATSGKVYEINSAGTQLWTKTFQGSIAKAFKYDSCYIFNTPPAIPTITGNATTLTSSAATTYQWYLNGALIAGATSMTFTPAVSGVYVVRITDANGCVYQYSKGYKFTKAGTGINELNLSDAITVYPNPTTGHITIQDGGQFGAEFTVSVIDYTGNIVYSSSNNKDLNLGAVADGLYTLRITSKNINAFKRINIIK